MLFDWMYPFHSLDTLLHKLCVFCGYCGCLPEFSGINQWWAKVMNKQHFALCYQSFQSKYAPVKGLGLYFRTSSNPTIPDLPFDSPPQNFPTPPPTSFPQLSSLVIPTILSPTLSSIHPFNPHCSLPNLSSHHSSLFTNHPPHLPWPWSSYPTYTSVLVQALGVWVHEPAVTTPLLKLFAELAQNRAQRLQFDVSSPNGILLFREISKVIVGYGESVIDLKVYERNREW